MMALRQRIAGHVALGLDQEQALAALLLAGCANGCKVPEALQPAEHAVEIALHQF